MTHKCTDTECPFVGQRTSKGCGCHQTDEQVLRAENERLRGALDHIAISELVTDNWVAEFARTALEGLDQHTSKVA
jgi:hypothetical protein